jgi:hypothetical protein
MGGVPDLTIADTGKTVPVKLLGRLDQATTA